MTDYVCKNCGHPLTFDGSEFFHSNPNLENETEGKNYSSSKECSFDGCVCIEPDGNGTTKREKIEIVPNPGRLMTTLRDLGYDFVRAVADIVDNSISAGADSVDITMKFDGLHSWFLIADNGVGMTAAELNEAMCSRTLTV